MCKQCFETLTGQKQDEQPVIQIPELERNHNNDVEKQQSQVTTWEVLYLNNIDEAHPRTIPCNWKLWRRTAPISKKLQSLSIDLELVDQGWGNMKGEIELKLCRGPAVDRSLNEWHNEGSGDGPNVVHRASIAKAVHEPTAVQLKLDGSSPFVSQFKPGD